MNTAYPIGLIIAPSESLDLYEMLFEGIWHFVKTTGFNPGFNFPVLSDAGLALRAFCLRHKLPQFQCHRHLIEWFGNCSIMRVMFLKILRSPSFEVFQNSLRLSNDVFTELKKAGRLTNSVIAKYLDFTGQVLDQQGNPTVSDSQRDKLKEWALWERGVVTTCSNHAESFHRVLKQAVKPNGKHVGIGKCLLTCRSQIQKKQNSWKRAFTRNFSSYIRGGERPPDWQYVREVARRFELTIPQTQAKDVSERQVLEQMREIGESALEKVTICRWVGKSILTGMWVDTQSPSDLPNEAKPDETEIADDGDPVIQMAKDIYAVIGDDINRREPFAWIFHWCLEVIDRENLDPGTELARAYIAAWEYIKTKTQ